MEADLLAEIVANPDDDGPRLVLADWWTQQGDPRGEFVVAQCAAARERGTGGNWRVYAHHNARADALLAEHADRWLAPLGVTADHVHFERGFVSRVSRSTETATAALYQQPIRELWVTLYEGLPTLADMLAKPWPRSLEGLSISGEREDPGVAVLGTSTVAGQLRQLTLRRCGLTDDLLRRFAEQPLPALHELDVPENPISASGLVAVVRAHRLRKLHIAECQVDAAILRALAGCAELAELDWLGLWENPIDGDGLAALAASPHLANLRTLLLWNNPRVGDGVAAVAGLTGLTRLQAFECSIGEAGVAALARSALPLANLEVGGNLFGDAGAHAIAAGGAFARLAALDAGDCKLTIAGALALARSPHLTELEVLELGLADLADIGTRVAELVRPGLDMLALSWCRLDAAAIETLARTPALATTSYLYLDKNPLGDRGAHALATSPYLDDIALLNLEDCELSERARAELRERFGDRVWFGE